MKTTSGGHTNIAPGHFRPIAAVARAVTRSALCACAIVSLAIACPSRALGTAASASPGRARTPRRSPASCACSRPFANLLARYSGKPAQRALAEAALRYLADPRIALAGITEPGILLADAEFNADSLHLTAMGAKADPAAKVPFSTLQHLPPWYKRVEWRDKAEGELPNADVSYPSPKRTAAFVCSENHCSLPIFDSKEIAEFVQSSRHRP